MTTTAITTNGKSSFPFALTREQIELVKRTIAHDLSDDELALFIHQCHRTGLDPLARQIYAQKRWNKQQQLFVLSIQATIDGFRLIAQRSKKYTGQIGPYWCGEDGVWQEVWLQKTYPVAARVGVLRSDFSEPLWAVSKFASYAPTYKRDGQWVLFPMWQKMPDHMIAKVAEALALRRAFPNELSGLYTPEEMSQSAQEVPQEHEQQQEQPLLPAAQKAQEVPKRPFQPVQLRQYMQSLVYNLSPAPHEIIAQAQIAFAKLSPEPLDRIDILNFLFGKSAVQELGTDECHALLRWCAVQEVEGKLQPSKNAVKEAIMVVEYLLE